MSIQKPGDGPNIALRDFTMSEGTMRKSIIALSLAASVFALPAAAQNTAVTIG